MPATAPDTAALPFSKALPPEAVTFVNPSDAFDVVCDAASFAVFAVEDAAFAASVVVEALRVGERWNTVRKGLETVRTAEADMSRRGRMSGSDCVSAFSISRDRRERELLERMTLVRENSGSCSQSRAPGSANHQSTVPVFAWQYQTSSSPEETLDYFADPCLNRK